MGTRRGEADGRSPVAAAVLAVLVPVAVGAGIYFSGTLHTPNYGHGPFGAHGTVAVDLEAQLSTRTARPHSSSSASPFGCTRDGRKERSPQQVRSAGCIRAVVTTGSSDQKAGEVRLARTTG